MSTFYIDPVNGKNRNIISNYAAASNPSGSTVLITCPSNGTPPIPHEYITGMQVVLTYFTAWLNTTWTITVIDDFSFTLNDAIWQATADPTGTCTPASGSYGGDSWATAWRTLDGAAYGRISAGDEVRIAKSPDPVFLGDCDWSAYDKIVLPTKQVQLIDDCEVLWTPATNVTVAYGSTPKSGSKNIRVSIALNFTTGKAAFKALDAPLNLSSYQGITFYNQINLTYVKSSTFKICLCSDTSGEVVVDSFTINNYVAGANTNTWYTLMRDGGGNLGSNINSIALYMLDDIGAINFTLDHILACKSDGIHLGSLISLNSNAKGGSEPWYCIRCFDGETIYIDYANNIYGGAHDVIFDEPQPTFIRNSILTNQVTSSSYPVQTINVGGASSTPIAKDITSYIGGYNPVTGLCDGMSMFNGQNYFGYGLYMAVKVYVNLENIGLFKYGTGMLLAGIISCAFKNIFGSSNSSPLFSATNCMDLNIDTLIAGGHNPGFIELNNCNNSIFYSCRNAWCGSNSHIKLNACFNIKIQFENYHPTSGFAVQLNTSSNNIIFFDSVFTRQAYMASFPTGGSNFSTVQYHNCRIFNSTDLINYKQFGAPDAIFQKTFYQDLVTWDFSKGSTNNKPVIIQLAMIAFNANSQVTVIVNIAGKTNGIFGYLRIRKIPYLGIQNDLEVLLQDTSFSDYTLQFTPTMDGVIELELVANGNFYLRTITVSQL